LAAADRVGSAAAIFACHADTWGALSQSLLGRVAAVAPVLAPAPPCPYIPRLRRPAFAGSDALLCRATMRGEASKAPDFRV